MAWYGSFSSDTKVLDALIDRKPTLGQLLECPEFLPNLKLFNPKLLDFLTNSPSLPIEILNYLVIPPSEMDSVDRKFRFPLLTIQMIESETTCIVNSFFKMCRVQKYQKQMPAIVAMFYLGIRDQEILPLLAGYMQRAFVVLYRVRIKQLVDVVYGYREIFDMLVEKSSNTCMAAILSLLLNLDITKSPVSSEDKLSVKVITVRKILEKMSIQWRKFQSNQDTTGNSILVFQNLTNVIRDLIEKYCLIVDGKPMLEIILEQKHTNLIIQCTFKQSEFSHPAMDLILTLIKYYSFSAFNSEEGTQELAKKNMDRLQSQYFITKLNQNFQKLLLQVKNCPKMTLYNYKLLEVLCHCMTLSSQKMFQRIKQTALYPSLIQLLFKHENCNILHKLIERAFLHIFVTQKKIYDLYKKYLFCEISIIDLTVNKILGLFPEKGLEAAIKKGYFGIFMKIVKIYSAIETTDEQIRQAITSKSQIWNKMSKKFIKPYELVTKQKLGEIKKNDELIIPQVQYTVARSQNSNPTVQIFSNSQVSLLNKAIKQIKEEQEKMPKTLELNSNDGKITDIFNSSSEDSLGMNCENSSNINKEEQDNFFKVPDTTLETDKKFDKVDETRKGESSPNKNAFSSFMNEQMAEAEKEIKRKRSLSSEQRLGTGKKSRMTSPSPNRKKNSWKEEDDSNNSSGQPSNPNPNPKPDKRIALTKDIPKIPTPHLPSKENSLSKSAIHEVKKEEPEKQFSMSMANLQSLKRTKIVRIEVKPQEKKKYRKVEEKDKPLLMYLGIKC